MLATSSGEVATDTLLGKSRPTFTGAGHQWTVSTNIDCCNQWLSLAKPVLKWSLLVGIVYWWCVLVSVGGLWVILYIFERIRCFNSLGCHTCGVDGVLNGYLFFPTTLLIPFPACCYVELRCAIISYSGVQFFTDESSISCSDIIKHKRLCLVKCYTYVKWL